MKVVKNVIQCANGHYFDRDIYEQCPHCGVSIALNQVNEEKSNSVNTYENNQSEENQKKRKFSFFGGKKKEDKKDAEGQAEIDKESEIEEKVELVQEESMEEEKTVLIEPVTPPPSIMEKPQAMPVSRIMPVSQAIQSPQRMPAPQQMPAPQPMAQCNQGDKMQTVAFYDSVIEPVTGWLVCIKGECFGESFELKVGRNNIGRGTNMDVALLREMSISRDKHAIIVFDPMHLNFLIQSGENGLTYVNDELLMGYKELQANDKIMLGTAVFMFVPLCGVDFDWKNYQN